MYKITLSDGTELDNLTLNGNNYIAEGEVKSDFFDGKLDKVIITDGTDTQTYTDMALLNCAYNKDGKTYIVLAEKTDEEKAAEAYNTALTDLQVAIAEIYESIV